MAHLTSNLPASWPALSPSCSLVETGGGRHTVLERHISRPPPSFFESMLVREEVGANRRLEGEMAGELQVHPVGEFYLSLLPSGSFLVFSATWRPTFGREHKRKKPGRKDKYSPTPVFFVIMGWGLGGDEGRVFSFVVTRPSPPSTPAVG